MLSRRTASFGLRPVAVNLARPFVYVPSPRTVTHAPRRLNHMQRPYRSTAAPCNCRRHDTVGILVTKAPAAATSMPASSFTASLSSSHSRSASVAVRPSVRLDATSRLQTCEGSSASGVSLLLLLLLPMQTPGALLFNGPNSAGGQYATRRMVSRQSSAVRTR